jgi:hypothetical protein
MRCKEIRSAAMTSSFASLTFLMASAAIADDSKPAVTPHQMAHCMIQRIHEDRRGDRTESYKEAFKACKQDLSAEADRGTTTAMNSGNDTEASK